MIETINGREVNENEIKSQIPSTPKEVLTTLPRGQWLMEDILNASYEKLKRSEIRQISARKETPMLKSLLIERTIIQLIQIAERISLGEVAEAEKEREKREQQKKKSKAISKFSRRMFNFWTKFLTKKCNVNVNRSLTYGRVK